METVEHLPEVLSGQGSPSWGVAPWGQIASFFVQEEKTLLHWGRSDLCRQFKGCFEALWNARGSRI